MYPNLLFAAGLLLSLAGCSQPAKRPAGTSFAEVAQASGVDFQHQSGANGAYLLIETMGAGGAFLDVDGDGLLDIFLVDGFALSEDPYYPPPGNLVREDADAYWVSEGGLPPLRFGGEVDPASALVRPPPGADHGDRFYHNEGDGRFADQSDRAGTGDPGYGMGCTTGDFDNDGDPDLYVANYGPNTLYRNDGTGRFADVTAAAGVGDPRWSTSPLFFDFDRDGDLDLFVPNYLDFTPAANRVCGGTVSSPGSRLLKIPRSWRSYCSPLHYNGAPNTLYRNEGDGTFVDLTRPAGLFNLFGKGLGAVAGDFDRDGDDDLFVANDGMRNFLYRNEGGRSFSEIGTEAGVALGPAGQAEAGMGTDCADYDGDGDLDLVVTNFSRESNRLYRNEGPWRYSDATDGAGLTQPSFLPLGFGTLFFEADNDGDLDLVVANGHVQDRIALLEPDLSHAQTSQLYENRDAFFTDVSATSGPAFALPLVGRGLASGDYDNDGDLDLLITSTGGQARLFRNDLQPGSHWLNLKLRARAPRDATGAWVELRCGGQVQTRQVKTGGSYLAASDGRLHFGLGPCARIDTLAIRWPDGGHTELRDLAADQFLTVDQIPSPR
ncbi:MAG: CRTAC1 family protein [Candidatus Handelsmanbacteria bacterium]|nr:CRTAC1 family protein [Candidatus Handelsmanbacteria bacterium]